MENLKDLVNYLLSDDTFYKRGIGVSIFRACGDEFLITISELGNEDREIVTIDPQGNYDDDVEGYVSSSEGMCTLRLSKGVKKNFLISDLKPLLEALENDDSAKSFKSLEVDPEEEDLDNIGIKDPFL